MPNDLGIFAAAFTVIVTIIGAVWSLKGEFASLRSEFGDKMHKLGERLVKLETHIFGEASFYGEKPPKRRPIVKRTGKRKRR